MLSLVSSILGFFTKILPLIFAFKAGKDNAEKKELETVVDNAKESAHTQGHRLVQRPDIQERIEELEKEIETNIDVVAEIENQYTYAKNNGHTNSAIKALEVLSKVRTSKDEEVPKSIVELEDEIVKNLEILGLI